jgi:uncharacterized membrane protein (DUF4010 family)
MLTEKMYWKAESENKKRRRDQTEIQYHAVLRFGIVFVAFVVQALKSM